MKRVPDAIKAAGFLVLVGCVVIPDTFDMSISIDIRHIKQQADDLLGYVAGEIDDLPEIEADDGPQSSRLRQLFEFLSPVRVVYAAQAKDSSPLVTKLAIKMRERNAELSKLKKTGAAGENSRGLVELVKPEALGGSDEKNAAQRLIAAENEDRKALYKEIARINSDQNLKVGAVERVYAQKRLERAKRGELFQLPPAGEDFGAFKQSTAGKKLGSACVPGTWVTIR
jgi:uncharacterized protein YdbL (DUF1318 family)